MLCYQPAACLYTILSALAAASATYYLLPCRTNTLRTPFYDTSLNMGFQF